MPVVSKDGRFMAWGVYEDPKPRIPLWDNHLGFGNRKIC
jgi:hypothetical protein